MLDFPAGNFALAQAKPEVIGFIKAICRELSICLPRIGGIWGGF